MDYYNTMSLIKKAALPIICSMVVFIPSMGKTDNSVEPSSTSNANTVEMPGEVRKALDAIDRRIQDLQKKTTSSQCKQNECGDRCPHKMGIYIEKVKALQKNEGRIKTYIAQINQKLLGIKRAMYEQVARLKKPEEEGDVCTEKIVQNLEPIQQAARKIDIASKIHATEWLLECMDKAIAKLNDKIIKARQKGNLTAVMRIDAIRGQLANLRSTAADLSQQFSVHENKRGRLESDAGNAIDSCKTSPFDDLL